MQQHFNYGLYLRDRYGKFLNETYNRNRVLVRSSDFDRTIMSAESLLAGLYAPKSYQVWNKNISWQPIAIHTTEAKYDNLFFTNNCSRLEQLNREVESTDEYRKMNNENEDLFKVLDANTGEENISIETVWFISDVLYIEVSNYVL